MFLSKLSSKWRRVVTAIVVVGVLAVFLFFPRERAQQSVSIVESSFQGNSIEASMNDETMTETIDETDYEPVVVIVDVKGAVKYPGVYTMQEGDRLIDAITAAGGYLPEADSRMLNHALRLADEAVIYVPIYGEELPEISESHQPNTQMDDRININTATEQQLQTLPGIGPSKASAIIEHRTERGPFQKVEDIMQVSGIGQKTFERLESLIVVK